MAKFKGKIRVVFADGPPPCVVTLRRVGFLEYPEILREKLDAMALPGGDVKLGEVMAGVMERHIAGVTGVVVADADGDVALAWPADRDAILDVLREHGTGYSRLLKVFCRNMEGGPEGESEGSSGSQSQPSGARAPEGVSSESRPPRSGDAQVETLLGDGSTPTVPLPPVSGESSSAASGGGE